MPPKRIIKNNLAKPKPPMVIQGNDGSNDKESTDAELKFDREVLWAISQFEKLISTGKLSEAKKKESIKAINTLRKPNTPKIQKIQLMRQYFKDIKAKMQKDEENQTSLAFQLDEEIEPSKSVFLKKKSQSEVQQQTPTSTFRFNFKGPSADNLDDVTSTVNELKLCQ